MKYTYNIIDQNAASCLQLKHFMEEFGEFFCAQVDKAPSEGLNSILKYKPEVVLVNLNLGASELFGMVRDLFQFMERPPLFIGIARDTTHAFQALKHQFFDYWVLPYNEFDIRKTLMKLKRQLPEAAPSPTLCLQSYKDYQYLDTGEILYLQADNNATDFIMKDGRRISAYKTLKTFEHQLPGNFVRVHQSYIINRDYISRINYGKNRCSLRHVDGQLPFSRGYKNNVDALKELLTQRAIKREP